MPLRSDEQGAEGTGPLPRFTGHERERELGNDVYYRGEVLRCDDWQVGYGRSARWSLS